MVSKTLSIEEWMLAMICDNVQEEMLQYLANNGFSETDTVGMMTAVNTTDAVIKEYEHLLVASSLWLPQELGMQWMYLEHMK